MSEGPSRCLYLWPQVDACMMFLDIWSFLSLSTPGHTVPPRVCNGVYQFVLVPFKRLSNDIKSLIDTLLTLSYNVKTFSFSSLKASIESIFRKFSTLLPWEPQLQMYVWYMRKFSQYKNCRRHLVQKPNGGKIL